MKTKLVAFFVSSTALLVGGARAQTVQPTAPAPVPPAMAPSAATVVNQTVYSQRLPSVNELSSAAAAQGLTVERIEQTATQITVVFRSANGQTTTVAYLLLPGAGSGVATGSPAANAAVVTPTTPPPAVYYVPAPRVVYYEDYGPAYYGYPYAGYWYPPVSIGLGFGFRSGGFHGGGHRGFHR